VLGGDYDATPRWAPSAIPAGRPLPSPTALFRKLDDGVVEQELDRMRERAGTA
jgi:methionyl-tRNA synthetase